MLGRAVRRVVYFFPYVGLSLVAIVSGNSRNLKEMWRTWWTGGSVDA